MVSELKIPQGKVYGTAVVKDKDGNIKYELQFKTEDSKEQEKVIGYSDSDERR
jgi:hypothetical protein